MKNFFVFLTLLMTSIVSYAKDPINHEQKVVSNESNIEVTRYKQEAIIPYLTTLQSWSVREFGHAPYLYAPSKEQIVCISDVVLVNSNRAELALARKDGKLVGLVATVAFDVPELHGHYFFQHDLINKMRSAGFEPGRMLYVAYFLTAPECHNDPAVVDALYASTVQHAYAEGKSELCYMEDIGPAPTKIEPWGAVIHDCTATKVQVVIPWSTKQGTQVKEVPHTLEFYVHKLL
jgi:hypothetical protein